MSPLIQIGTGIVLFLHRFSVVVLGVLNSVKVLGERERPLPSIDTLFVCIVMLSLAIIVQFFCVELFINIATKQLLEFALSFLCVS